MNSILSPWKQHVCWWFHYALAVDGQTNHPKKVLRPIPEHAPPPTMRRRLTVAALMARVPVFSAENPWETTVFPSKYRMFLSFLSFLHQQKYPKVCVCI